MQDGNKTEESLMRKLGGKFERWWLPSLPASRLASLRIVVGTFAWIYLLAQAPNFWHCIHYSSEQFVPVGLVFLTHASPPMIPLVVGVYVACLILGALFVLGIWHRPLAVIYGAIYLWLFTYRSSWGMVFHTDNQLVIHLMILAISPACDAWSIDSSRQAESDDRTGPWYGWPVQLISVTTVLTYFLAGWAKVDRLGFQWLAGDELRQQIAYDNLRKMMLGDIYSPLGVLLLEWSWLFPLLAWLTLIFELGAPLALCQRRVAQVWVLGIWAFHAGVFATMVILFPYPLFGVAYLSFFPIERYLAKLRIGSFFRKFSNLEGVSPGC